MGDGKGRECLACSFARFPVFLGVAYVRSVPGDASYAIWGRTQGVWISFLINSLINCSWFNVFKRTYLFFLIISQRWCFDSAVSMALCTLQCTRCINLDS